MSEEEPQTGNVRAVERAIDILQSFTIEQSAMTVPDLQRKTGLSRPTLYRLLTTLAGKGMVRSEGDPLRFSLDHAAARLGRVWLSRVDLASSARPILERLRDDTNETAALFLLRGGRQFCAAEATSRQALAMSRGLGEMEHMTRGASGKAILAFLPQNQVLAAMPRNSPAKIRSALLHDLQVVRQDGFATSYGEIFVGAIAIAAPVFDHAGQVVGSIGLFGPEARMPPDKMPHAVTLVIGAARSLSAELGHLALTTARSDGSERIGKPTTRRPLRQDRAALDVVEVSTRCLSTEPRSGNRQQQEGRYSAELGGVAVAANDVAPKRRRRHRNQPGDADSH